MATPLQSGAADFARALLSGGEIESNAQLKRQMLYDQQDSGRAELDRKITEALLKRGERTAVLDRPGAYQRTLGVDPQTGTDLATLQLAGNESIDAMQKFNLRNAALRALQSPELNLAPGNAELAALDGKPLQHVTTEGVNTIENRYSDAPALDLTELGRAQVRANDARAAASNAQANLANVKAAGGGFAPSSGGGRGGINVTRADAGKKATYTGSAVGGAKGVEQAKAILKDLIGTGGDPHGYSVGSVKRDMVDDGEVGMIAERAPGSLRFITGSNVRDIPGVVPQAPSTAPVAAPVAEAAAAPAAVPPPPQRVRGQVYPTPRGPMVWTGTGWMPAP